MSKTLNFDLFLQEKNKETLTVTVLGKEYQVPMEIPAIVPVMLARSEESMDDTKGNLLLIRALDMMLGEDNVTEICRKGLSSREMMLLAQKIFTAITKGEYDENETQELSDNDSRAVTRRGKSEKK